MFSPLLLLATLAAAHADEVLDRPASVHHIRDVRLDAHADFGGYGSLGAGFRVDIPIVRNGLIAGTDDELAISPGADLFFQDFYHGYYDGGPYVIPTVALQWNFYVSSHWSVFPEAGIAFYVGDRDYMRHDNTVYAAGHFGLGARYHFNDTNALLLRVSNPTGFQVGLTF
jgi:hypothetical protein